jgi:hypothetical protein
MLFRADALPTLLDERDYGLLTSVLSLLQGLVAADSSRYGRTEKPPGSCTLLTHRLRPRLRAKLSRVCAQGGALAGSADQEPRRASRLFVLLAPLAVDAGEAPLSVFVLVRATFATCAEANAAYDRCRAH